MSLTYDLCRQLQEAGFPQKEFMGCDDCGYCNAAWEREPVSETGRWCYRPTIEDLIRELGDVAQLSLYMNRTNDSGWISAAAHAARPVVHSRGDTPEEALANLYLATR